MGVMRNPGRRRLGLLAAGSLALAALSTPGAPAAEPTSSSTVAGNAGWVPMAYQNTSTGPDYTPQQSDTAGPQRAPYGTSSHRLVIGESTVQTELYRTGLYDGTMLSDLTRLEYSAFARRTDGAGALRTPTYLRLNVDNDGDGVRDASLFFYPANNATQQPYANDIWQQWDVVAGRINVGGDGGPAATTTLAAYAAANPASTLVNNDAGMPDGGSHALINGGYYGGAADPQIDGEYFVDRVIVGVAGQDTLYDLGGDDRRVGTVADTVLGPRHLAGWVQRSFDAGTHAVLPSSQRFVTGPAPLGDGSLRLRTGDATGPDRVEQLRTAAYDGTLLRDVRRLDYSTLERPTAGSTAVLQPVSLRLDVDNDGNGSRDAVLTYSPAANGPVLPGSWQTWDAAGGRWDVDADSGQASGVTLENYLVAHPDARIVADPAGTPAGGGVTFQVGGPGLGQADGSYYLDAMRLTTVDAASGQVESGDRFDPDPTRVDLALEQGKKRRVRLHVATGLPTPGVRVLVYRVTRSGPVRLLKDELNARGRITRLLADRYPAGTRVKLFVTVRVDGATYRSDRARITIR
jgi:hypothetical protein